MGCSGFFYFWRLAAETVCQSSCLIRDINDCLKVDGAVISGSLARIPMVADRISTNAMHGPHLLKWTCTAERLLSFSSFPRYTEDTSLTSLQSTSPRRSSFLIERGIMLSPADILELYETEGTLSPYYGSLSTQQYSVDRQWAKKPGYQPTGPKYQFVWTTSLT